MARTQPITARAVDVALDLKAAFHELAMADGVICAQEAEVGELIDRILGKVERIDRARVIGRNVEDTGEIGPWALRMNREMNRDLGEVISLDDYRTSTA